MPFVMGRYLRVCMGQEERADEVPVVNERQKQTYYGALNLYSQQFLVKAYDKGNSYVHHCFCAIFALHNAPKAVSP